MAESCVSDTELTGEEAAIFAQLSLLGDDAHPDAHACRLKISLATVATSFLECGWAVEDEMEAYLEKLDVVSAACRLTLAEEAELLDICHRRIFQGKTNTTTSPTATSAKAVMERLRPTILNRRELVHVLVGNGARSMMRQESAERAALASTREVVRVLYTNAQGLADYKAQSRSVPLSIMNAMVICF